MRILFRIFAGVCGVVGITLSFLFGPVSTIPDLIERTVRFFSFFTILTNILAATAMLSSLFLQTRIGRFFDQPDVRTAVTGYILMVGILYHSLLFDDLLNRDGLGFAASIICHYVTPVLFALDWIIFVPRGILTWRDSAKTMLYPLVYLLWTLLHGAMTGWYPYPFLDAGTLGYSSFFGSAAMIAGLIMAMELCLILADRMLAGSRMKVGVGADSQVSG